MKSIPFHPIINEDKSKPSTPPTTPLTELTPISPCNIKTEFSETTPSLGLVDMESIAFHPIVNQGKSKTPTPATDPLTQQTQLTATTQTVIRKAIFKPKEEPETEIEVKFQPEIPEFEPYFYLHH